jgi:hypothetical protein
MRAVSHSNRSALAYVGSLEWRQGNVLDLHALSKAALLYGLSHRSLLSQRRPAVLRGDARLGAVAVVSGAITGCLRAMFGRRRLAGRAGYLPGHSKPQR